MTSTVVTAVIALSAFGLAVSPITRRQPATESDAHAVAGGPPDTLVVNPAASSIRWNATGFGGRGARTGTVALASGLFVIRHEQLTSGTFTIDMQSIDVTDIPATDVTARPRVRDQLRSVAFFDAERYPTSVFRSTGAKRVGPARWQIAGTLTMHGVTRPIAFETDVRWLELGHMVATSTFTIDRRQWDVASRGSGLATDLVDDAIQLSLTLDARRKRASVATR